MADYDPRRLPETVADLVARRTSMRGRSLHDDVDECHIRLWNDPKYRRWFDAIHPSMTIEGSFAADDYMAATMIRDYAKANQLPIAEQAKLAAIVFSLHWICRRYKMSRKERQNPATGEDERDAAE